MTIEHAPRTRVQGSEDASQLRGATRFSRSSGCGRDWPSDLQIPYETQVVGPSNEDVTLQPDAMYLLARDIRETGA